ncbi:hypothetical protein K443DRAFT_96091, partial [Laccaria amethystina LaAM-08-1]
CFSHVVNLACKAILLAITSTDFAGTGECEENFFEYLDKDPVATLRKLVNAIQSSSLRRQHFSTIVETMCHQDLQLLRDVDTRWSSTLLMTECALELELAITEFLRNDEFDEVRKHKLNDSDWDALNLFRNILQVPHAFQHALAVEKTPTLSNAIPAFEAMIKVWDNQKADDPEAAQLIQPGLDKLAVYLEQTDIVPAYIVSMSKSILHLIFIFIPYSFFHEKFLHLP